MKYVITYDNHPPRDYSALYRLLASWGAVKLAESVWLADLTGTASDVRDVVGRALQSGDTVAVLELKAGSGWATLGVSAAANAWLSRNILPSQKAA